VPVSAALRRLLHIRELEEDLSKSELEVALAEMRRLEQAFDGAKQREHSGRLLVRSSAQTGSLTDRIAGLEDMRAACHSANTLSIALATAEQRVVELRNRLLSKRVQRQQAGTLVERHESRAMAEDARREQQEMDDLHRSQSWNGSER
jgi:flagellar export protein FliJ